jgi:hypothetical protein
VLIPLLVNAEKFNLKYFGLGGNLGSVFLNGGTKYFPAHKKKNQWVRLFESAGVPMFCPLAGVSDVGVINILGVDFEKSIYCQKGKDGTNCHKCNKCIRRDNVYQCTETDKLEKIIGPSVKWVNNPLKYDWVNRYYPSGIDYQPNELRNLVKDKLQRYLKPMTKEEINYVESYDESF